MPFCQSCGYEVSSTDRFCYRCGKQILNELQFLLENKTIKTASNNNLHEADLRPPKIESEILNLPYSWTLNDVEITLLGLTLAEGYEHGIPLDNRKQYEVIIKFRNLLNTSNKITNGYLGFDSLKLKTDVGNIWDLRYDVGNAVSSESLDPQEEFIKNESVFEIREKEIPQLLLAEIFGKNYVFDVALVGNRQHRESAENYQLRQYEK